MDDDYKYITLLDTSTPGTYTVSVNEDTIAEVAVVGGGGGGVGCAHGGAWFYADGGGGAAFVGTINLPAGVYPITVGAGGASNFNPSSASDAGSVTGGNSSLSDLIIAGGGIRGSGTNCVYPGAGGTLTVNVDVISSTIQSNGNNAKGGGTSGHGQAQSLYEGYGKGGMGIYGGSVAGTNGYVRIKIRVPNNTPKFYPLMKREKAYWKTWHQPILTSNGTMGGDSFAVSSNVSSLSGREPWKALNGNSNNDDRWQSVSTNGTVTFDFYNPQPLKLHSLVLNYGNGESYYYPKEVIIQGSDDGNSWTDLTTFTNNAYAASFNIQVNSSSGYKYHRLKFVSFNGYNSDNMYVLIRELIITADYYDEHYTYKAYNIMQRQRAYFKYSTWNQPILTSNTSYGTITASSDHSEPSEPWHILSSSSSAGERFLFNGTGGQWIKWELPKPIKVNSCTVYNSKETSYLNRFPKSITFQVSEDGNNWKNIKTVSGYSQPGAKASISFDCETDKEYPYICFYFENTFGASPMAVGLIRINAQEVIDGTSSDYDFYKDSYKAYNIVKRRRL